MLFNHDFLTLLQGQPEPVNADDILKKAKLPVAGDLLGRERITGAKNTGLGYDSPSERFTNIVEIPALWHTNQSFLGVRNHNLYIIVHNSFDMQHKI